MSRKFLIAAGARGPIDRLYDWSGNRHIMPLCGDQSIYAASIGRYPRPICRNSEGRLQTSKEVLLKQT